MSDASYAVWRLNLVGSDEPSVGPTLVAMSHVVLPYFDARFVNDDDFGDLVAAMDRWVVAQDMSTVQAVRDRLLHVADEREQRPHLSMPFDPAYLPLIATPLAATTPGEFAGDAIVAAANYIVCDYGEERTLCAERCVRSAEATVSYAIGNRSDEETDVNLWELAQQKFRQSVESELVKLSAT